MYAERISVPDEQEKLPGINYILGLDLGQSQDYTAIAIVEKVQSQYHVRKLERTRGTSYPDIVARVKSILIKFRGATLVVDQTGVGAPVVDMFEEAGMRPTGVHITGGDHATNNGYGAHGEAPRRWRTPKRDLVGTLQVLLQNKRLKIAPGPLSDTLAAEMLNFKVKIDPETAHDGYSAWREADHDDLVLATALACWFAENRPRPPIVSTPLLGHMHGEPGRNQSICKEYKIHPTEAKIPK